MKNLTHYALKLKDPRWQKMRLQVLEKSGFKCADCDDSESTLHVHHTEYVWGKNPWEYDPSTLICLCENCHLSRENMKKQIAENTKTILRGASYDRALRLSNLLEDVANIVTLTNEDHRVSVTTGAFISILELHSQGKKFTDLELSAINQIETIFNLKKEVV